ncbi:hypothetical protein FACS189427_00850 [Planctomycetales bacterium]|nr:hypothetical protein FACS189427_00850 [Planctomycetales bacterium]
MENAVQKNTAKYKNIQYSLVSALLFFTGCHLAGNSQPNNPFASIQTAAPPATFSAQGAYLGQTPSASYVPQTPAAAFTPSTVPVSIPAATPASGASNPFSPVNTPVNTAQPYSVPASAGYGSLNSNQGASLFQNNGQNASPSVYQSPPVNTNTSNNTEKSAVPASAAQTTGWTAALPSEPAAQSFQITAGYANQTAAQGMENIAGQTIQPTSGSTAVSTYIDPNAVVASSSQMTTIIEDDKKNSPAPAEAQPKTMYANQY